MTTYSSLTNHHHHSTDNLIIRRESSPDVHHQHHHLELDNNNNGVNIPANSISTSPPPSSANTSTSTKSSSDYRIILGQDDVDKRNQTHNFNSLHQPSSSRPFDFILNHPALPVMCYCAASILMTVVNKFVVSGRNFSMNFLLLTIQSVVCVTCVFISKRLGLITFRDFDMNDARRWFPISFLLVTVIYTGSKSLQFLSIPVYTIFKNMTIILIAYGEVVWFGGSVTSLTLVSFALMVVSSLTAAYSDIVAAFSTEVDISIVGQKSNIGYAWMMVNCFVSAGYVLAMRKRIKVTNFRDWDTMFYNNLLSIPVLVFFSLTIEDWSAANLAKNFPAETRNALLCAMCFSGAAAVFISYTTAWCVRTTSSTTFSMVGALNKLPVAASGMMFFGDAVTFPSVSAIFTGFVAGLVYAAAKSAQAAKAKILSGTSLDMSKPR